MHFFNTLGPISWFGSNDIRDARIRFCARLSIFSSSSLSFLGIQSLVTIFSISGCFLMDLLLLVAQKRSFTKRRVLILSVKLIFDAVTMGASHLDHQRLAERETNCHEKEDIGLL